MYKILIVEDDDTITAVLTRTFLKWNYEVQAVVDFGRVGEQFAQFSPDLVLLDVKMPLLNGIDAARLIREERSARCIVMLTSFDDQSCVEQALAAGAAGYLTKPLRAEDILPTLELCLSHTKEYYLLEKNCGSLKRRLASREIVDLAKLTVMEERGLTEEEAYVLIRELSRRKNLSMEQVARSILEKGEAPL